MIRIKALKFFRVFVPVNVFLYLAVMAFGPSLLAQEHDHSGHQMSPEVFAELREKVLLYREYTDEEIMGSMSRMGPNVTGSSRMPMHQRQRSTRRPWVWAWR
jgi:hypothetical protein